MWPPVCSLLTVAVAAAAAAAGTYDVGPDEIGSPAVAGVLRRLEQQQLQLAGRLEALTHTVDTQLSQLDASILQLYRELGSSRLRETLDALKKSAAASEAEGDVVKTLTQLIQTSESQLGTQLNDTQRQLSDLLTDVVSRQPVVVSDGSAVSSTVIVERCSYQDQFQTANQWRPSDCAAVQQRHQRSGVYTIYPTVCGNGGGIRVFCDMDTAGGGWTVLMRRAPVADHQDFNHSWQSYKWGFGNLTGEFWLGNEYMNLLTSMDQMQLRFDMKDWNNASATATYSPFSVGTEQQKYVLKLGKYEGNAGNSLTSYSNNAKFSTKDQDNDTWGKKCAVVYQSAWWHKSCMQATPTGSFKVGTIKTAWHGVTWYHWKGNKYSLKSIEMKMRPINYMTWCHRLAQEGARD